MIPKAQKYEKEFLDVNLDTLKRKLLDYSEYCRGSNGGGTLPVTLLHSNDCHMITVLHVVDD